MNIQRKRFEYIGNKVIARLVATFIRSGYQTAQEVKIDLLFFFGTSQNLTGTEDELYGFSECTGCIFSFLQNEFREKTPEGKIRTIDLS